MKLELKLRCKKFKKGCFFIEKVIFINKSYEKKDILDFRLDIVSDSIFMSIIELSTS